MNLIGAVILTCFLISFFNFFALLFFAIIIDSSKKFYSLTVSSFFTSISLHVLYFDIKALSNNQPNIFTTFITFLTLSSALVILMRTLIVIYDKQCIYKAPLRITYVVIGSVSITVATYFEVYFLRSLAYYLIVIFPFAILLFNHLIKDPKSKRSYVFYQAITILIISLVNIVYLFINRVNNPSVEISLVDIISSLLIAVIIITMYLTTVLEVIASDKQTLDNKNLLLELTYQKIKKISETDALTSLYNRRKMNDIIDAHYLNSIDYGSDFTIILMDADNFKSINDNYGHNEGDKVLQYIALSLTSVLRDTDFLGRWGGDEFIALLPNFDRNSIKKVVNKIHLQFQEYPYTKEEILVSLSIGIAHYSKDTELKDIIREADEMMYRNKDKKKEVFNQ